MGRVNARGGRRREVAWLTRRALLLVALGIALAWVGGAISAFASGAPELVSMRPASDATFHMSYPNGVAVDSGNNVFVTDGENDRVLKLSPSGVLVTMWGSHGSGDGQFSYCHGIAVDDFGNVYVADRYNRRIQKFSSSGAFITKWDIGEWTEGVAIDSGGNAYVAAYSSFQKFSPSGAWLLGGDGTVTGDGAFYMAFGIAVDSNDNVYVMDSGNNRVQKFSSGGNFITKWGSQGSGNGQFGIPYGIAVDHSNDNVYVADSDNNRIQKFSSSGAFIGAWGGVGSGDGQFWNPKAVAVDSAGNVYVADYMNNRIQKFSSNGTFIANMDGSAPPTPEPTPTPTPTPIPTPAPRTAPSLSNPVAPATMSHTRSYSMYATLKPRHAAGSYPVRIYAYRYASGRWKAASYVKAKAANYASYTKCSVRARLPVKGKWRLRAYAPADSAHSAKWSSGYDYVTVK